MRGLKKRDSREGGEGVPTDLRGKLTESELRKSKNLAKRRRQTNCTKFKAKKGSENRQNPAKATFGKKPLRERHFAKTCANDEDGSNTAPIPLILAKAYSELRRAPARPSRKTKEPQPGQLHALLCTVLESNPKKRGKPWGGKDPGPIPGKPTRGSS